MSESIPEIIASKAEAAYFMLPDFQKRITDGAKWVEKDSLESSWTVTKDPLNPGKYKVLPLILGGRSKVQPSFDDDSPLIQPASKDVQLNAAGIFHFHSKDLLRFSKEDIGFLEESLNGVRRSNEMVQNKKGDYQISKKFVRAFLPNVMRGVQYNIVFEPGLTFGLFAPIIKYINRKPVVEQVRYFGISGNSQKNYYQRLLDQTENTKDQISTFISDGFEVSYLELPISNGTPLWDKVNSIISGKQTGK